jgi:hypothetical protein
MDRLRIITIVGTMILIAGIVGLNYPVEADVSMAGVPIPCGTALTANLESARHVDDFSRMFPAPEGGPRSDAVGSCQSKLSVRRMWAIPVAALGVLVMAIAVVNRFRRPGLG